MNQKRSLAPLAPSTALDRAMSRLKTLTGAGYQFAQAVYTVSRELDIDPHKIFAEASRRSALHRAAKAASRRGGR